MTIAEELRAIAESVRLLMPYQSARLHVLADQVDTVVTANAVRRAGTSTVTTNIPPAASTMTAGVPVVSS
jgi:hypothetical protein